MAIRDRTGAKMGYWRDGTWHRHGDPDVANKADGGDDERWDALRVRWDALHLELDALAARVEALEAGGAGVTPSERVSSDILSHVTRSEHEHAVSVASAREMFIGASSSGTEPRLPVSVPMRVRLALDELLRAIGASYGPGVSSYSQQAKMPNVSKPADLGDAE